MSKGAPSKGTPRFFESAKAWRTWLETGHARETELLVGLYKRTSGRPCMSWPESVEEALCFGWIDGVRRSIDESSYQIRFTARKKGSTWSKVNMAKAESLIAAGKMTKAGLEAFRSRSPARSGIYSYEQGALELGAEATAAFIANPKAWEFFQKQAAWYVKKASWWVIRARLPATREKRLAKLIEASSRQKQFDDR
jgi:uncharacterized protein YdeI (YjbR/CyaY-like superfamily)